MTVLRALLNAERNPLLTAMLTIFLLAETRKRKPMLNNITSQLVVEALRKRKEPKSTVLGALLNAKKEMHCLWFLWLPRKQSTSYSLRMHIRTATYAYTHMTAGTSKREIASENNTGLFTTPGGELQPGYFHPRDVAADAPESAWLATSNDGRRNNNVVASHPTTALNNMGPLRGSPIVCTLGNGVCFVLFENLLSIDGTVGFQESWL